MKILFSLNYLFEKQNFCYCVDADSPELYQGPLQDPKATIRCAAWFVGNRLL